MKSISRYHVARPWLTKYEARVLACESFQDPTPDANVSICRLGSVMLNAVVDARPVCSLPVPCPVAQQRAAFGLMSCSFPDATTFRGCNLQPTRSEHDNRESGPQSAE